MTNLRIIAIAGPYSVRNFAFYHFLGLRPLHFVRSRISKGRGDLSPYTLLTDPVQEVFSQFRSRPKLKTMKFLQGPHTPSA